MNLDKKYLVLLSLVLALGLVMISFVGCSPPEEIEEELAEEDIEEEIDEEVEEEVTEDDKYGGTLVVANSLSPPHLDSDMSTSSEISQKMSHVYEGLFEIDENYEPQPHLAEAYEIQEDGLVYHVTLREGVLFHNGKEMTAEDVEASFERWLEHNGGGRSVAPFFDELVVLNDYEVEFRFEEPYAPFLSFMSSIAANQKFVVRPKELVEEYADDTLEEHIGTGPYEFVEYVPDQHVKLKRFEDYVPHPEPGYAYYGEKIAYVDELIFEIIPEESVRVSGVQTGEFHFADFVPRDQYPIFEEMEEVETHVISPYRQSFIIVNKGQPPFDNLKARQALNYALDREELAMAVIGDPEFFDLEPSIFPENNIWNVPDAGAGIYDNYDPEKAEQLLEESGYDGEPIVVLNSREDDVETNSALAIQDQLQKVGFNVELELLDRATVVELRGQVDTWNLHSSQFAAPDPDPQVYNAWMGTEKWIGNWDDEDSRKIDEIFERMAREPDYDKRYEIVEEWHEAFYEYVPYVKNFDFKQLRLSHESLHNVEEFVYHHFFNVWIEE